MYLSPIENPTLQLFIMQMFPVFGYPVLYGYCTTYQFLQHSWDLIPLFLNEVIDISVRKKLHALLLRVYELQMSRGIVSVIQIVSY